MQPCSEAADQQYLGQLLGESLITNQGWIPDDSLIAMVLAHCAPSGNCQQLKFFAMKSTFVNATRVNGLESYSIGPFNSRTFDLFEAKIDQFLRGTTFTLQYSHTPSPGRTGRLRIHSPGALHQTRYEAERRQAVGCLTRAYRVAALKPKHADFPAFSVPFRIPPPSFSTPLKLLK